MAKIPQWWQKNPSFRTQTELFNHRKKEILPDPTFDIDGDGEVGPTDLFLATLFDKDKDGKLNAQERAEADHALKSGFLSNFEFGLERCGPHKPIRQLQLRGMMVMDDDFRNIKDTYPFERIQSHPNFRTLRDLQQHRKAEIKAVAEENVNRRSQYKGPFITLVHSPKTSKVKAKWSDLDKESKRVQQGMLPKTSDLDSRDLPLHYTKNPQHRSCADLLLSRKKNLNTHYFQHKNPEKRLKEREDPMVMLSSGISYKEKANEVRRKDLEHNIKTFANQTIGIHGKELPKFKDNCKEYWKKLDSYIERSPIKEIKTEETFKKFIDKKKQEVTAKPNHIYPFNDDKAKFVHERVYTKHIPTIRINEETELVRPTSLVKTNEISKNKRQPDSLWHSSINGTKSIAHESTTNKHVSGYFQNSGSNKIKSVRTGGFSKL